MGRTRHTQEVDSGSVPEDGKEPESVQGTLSGKEVDVSMCLEALEGIPLPPLSVQMQMPLRN